MDRIHSLAKDILSINIGDLGMTAGQAIREFVEGYLRSRLGNISRSVGGGGGKYTFGGETETLP